MDELFADFLAETAENLVGLDEVLLRLERAPGDTAAIAVAFRLAHTIKGSCGFLNFPRMEKVAHAAEDLLGAWRNQDRQDAACLVPLILAAVDRIKQIVAGGAACGQEPDGDDAALLAAMCGALARPAVDGFAAATLPPDVEPEPTTAPAAQSIRVNVSTIETLMTLVSELVLTRNQLLQLARTDPDSRFATALQRLSHLTSDLQEGVMRTRMQPIRHAWNTVPRMVRDLAAELGKEISLDMTGEDTELDRQVLELIRAPLAHMVRNCADHGIEPIATRIAAGKPAVGTIRLNSFHEGGTVVIEVGDDGAGLSLGRIRERAAAQQLASPAELAEWGDRQLHRLIFMPGLSTAASVTPVSGRGVGLDIVQTNIARLGGTVDVSSAPGLGTTFTVRIPLTLAIISALSVEAGGQCFALPQSCISEVVRVDPHAHPADERLAVEHVDDTAVLRLRERLLPLVSLATLLGLKPAPCAGVQTIVVAQLGGLAAGLLVDRVFDTQEIVVKPVSRALRHIQVFSGSTILGDGSVIMILDPSGLSKAIGRNIAVTTSPKAVSADLVTADDASSRSALLLVRLTPGARLVAVLLGLVARIESIPRVEVQQTPECGITPYRGQLMPLVRPIGYDTEADPMQVLVFSDRGRSVGLVVADIVDIVEEPLTLELASRQAGLLGTAMVAGEVMEVLDATYWLMRGRQGLVRPAECGRCRRPPARDGRRTRSCGNFSCRPWRQSGYHVTAVDSVTKALALRDADQPVYFDAIISDSEMPGVEDLRSARHLGEGRWSSTPLLALVGQSGASERGHDAEAGFDEYLGKLDRAALLAALQRNLAPAKRQAA